MILVDTSVWIDHLRAGRLALQHLLERGAVLVHPWVTGELALGQLTQRQRILGLLSSLPSAIVVTPEEVLEFVSVINSRGLESATSTSSSSRPRN